jgi:single-strand DNA-binding protein
MTIPTQMSLHGFIATVPDLHFSENGVPRFYARVGVRQFRQNRDGSITELEPAFHDLVMFRKTAERAYEAFRKGDTFVASDYVNDNPFERHGQRIVREEFVARHVGHNLVLTKYVVERKQPAPPDPDLFVAPTNEPVPEPVVGL